MVYQGVEGAYAQQAMFAFFGEQVNHFHVERWRDAMDAIAEGMADYAVLPIENSTAGIVNDNYDLLEEYNNYIVGEQIIPIRHALIWHAGRAALRYPDRLLPSPGAHAVREVPGRATGTGGR